MEIARGIFFYQGRGGERIEPGASSSNVTVVRGEGGVAMIDTGVAVGGAYQALLEGIRADGLSLEELRWLLFTHCHADHINASAELLASGPIRTAAGEADVPYLEDADKNFRGFITDLGELTREVYPSPPAVVRFAMWVAWGASPRLTIDRPLSGGEVLDVGREVRAIALPGHTPGHMGYLIPDEGVLVLGDHIDFENAQGVDLNNPRSDYPSAMSSLERVIALEPEVVVPSHGEVLSGRRAVRRALEEALAFDRGLPGRLSGELRRGPRTLRELTEQTFGELTLSIEGMSMMVILNVLLHLEREGEVERLERSGRLLWAARTAGQSSDRVWDRYRDFR